MDINKIIFSLSLLTLINCSYLPKLLSHNAGTFHNVDQIEEYNNLVTNRKPSIIYCHSDLCDACKETDGSFENVSKKYNGQANFLKVNLNKDQLKTVGSKNSVEAVPTILLKDSSGKTQQKVRGSRTEKEYAQNIDNFLNNNGSPVKMAQAPVVENNTQSIRSSRNQLRMAQGPAKKSQKPVRVATRPANSRLRGMRRVK